MLDLSMREKTLIMFGVMLGMLLSALDQTAVSTAMPRIVASLGGLKYYSWVVTAYMLASTAAVPIVGKLSDIYGRKPFYLAGIVIFMVASVAAGVSQTMIQLVIFRGVQGLGGGILMANAFSVIGDIFPPSERGKWQGIIAGSFAIASVLGPLLGGTLTEQASWRWVFYINIPLGLAALTALAIVLPWPRPENVRHTIDYLGVATLLAWVMPLLLAFVWVGDYYAWWAWEMNALLAGAALMLAAFVWVESRAEEPIVPLHLFSNRIYTVSVIITFLNGMAMFGAIVFVPLFLQAVNGLTPTKAGLAMIPLSAGMVTASTLTGQIISRTGRYKIPAIIGGALVPVGLWLLSGLSADSSTTEVMSRTVIVGLGVGVGMPIYTVISQNALPYRYLGVATSSVQFFRSIGSTIGIAILGGVLTTQLATEVPRNLSANVQASTPPALFEQISDPKVLLSPAGLTQVRAGYAQLGPEGLRTFGEAMGGLRVAMAESITAIFAAAVVIGVLAFLVTWFLRELPLRTTHYDKAELEAEAADARAAAAGRPPEHAGAPGA